jgi:hypothetical protein
LQLSLDLARSTLDTITGDVGQALDRVRRELAQGLSRGEVMLQLNRRLAQIFDDPLRAARIAQTEASRAQHAGLVASAKAEGARAKRWLSSSDACDVCRRLDGRERPLDGIFTVVGTGPYSQIFHPPAHPHCGCTLEEVW